MTTQLTWLLMRLVTMQLTSQKTSMACSQVIHHLLARQRKLLKYEECTGCVTVVQQARSLGLELAAVPEQGQLKAMNCQQILPQICLAVMGFYFSGFQEI